jgi:aminopeptidase N
LWLSFSVRTTAGTLRLSAARSGRPGPGITRALARQRAETIRQLSYQLKLEIPEAPAAPVKGRVRIRFEIPDDAGWPAIDFAPVKNDQEAADFVSGIRVDEAKVSCKSHAGHLLLDAAAPTPGFHDIDIDFMAGQTGLIRRPDLVYTLFVPARAHCVFPCFDQPDLKAPLELELILPSGWNAIANSPESCRETASGALHMRFAETEKLPTYLFAFAAGRLDIRRNRCGGRAVLVASGPADSAALDRNLREILRIQLESLGFLERYTGISHPFAQLAMVLVPGFEFSGMEHPGGIFYRSEAVLLDESASLSAQTRRASLIAHETAHLWFGDLVTMPWFDDVWLKEACANFMADKIVADLYPNAEHALGFFLRHFPQSLTIDRSAGAHPIRRRLNNLADAGELYDALIYHKAPIAMAELEKMVGAATMQAGLRQYLRDFSFANADWPDLLARLEKSAGRDLGEFSQAWFESSGPPESAAGLDPTAPPVYGRPTLSEAGIYTASKSLASGKSALTRAISWCALYENMLDARIRPSELLTAACARLADEDSEQLAARILADLYEIYWRFLSPSERGLAAGPVERCLWLRLNTAAEALSEPGQVRAWLCALAQFAITPESWSALRSIAERKDPRFQALPESLFVDLVLSSALIEPAKADGLIERQAAITKDRRQRRRLEFLQAAVSTDPEVRDDLFERLTNRATDRELTITALRLLNHPRYAAESVHLLEPGIVQASAFGADNEIFLARRWLAALFHGHGSEMAAASICATLDAHTFTPCFRELAQETADLVFRAAAIRGRSAYP